MKQTAPSVLASEGGRAAAQGLEPPVWPPRDQTTRQRLAEIYDSGDWTFDLAGLASEVEATLATHIGTEHCVVMANGTATLEASLRALGVGPGDEVVVPALTWIGTATAVLAVGAIPVFSDVDPATLCIDVDATEDLVNHRTRAVIAVHLYGSMVDLDALQSVAARSGLAVIEDCAQSIGGRWKDRPLGSLGDVGSFSFHQTKVVSAGEGGACTTDAADLAERIHQIAYVGYHPDDPMGAYTVPPPANLLRFNYRITEFQAAILLEQLDRLDHRTQVVEDNVGSLGARLDGVEGLRLQAPGRRATRQSYWKLPVIFDKGPLADVPLARIRAALIAEGVPVQDTHGPVYRHVLFNFTPDHYRVPPGGCPVSETLATERTLAVPHEYLEDPRWVEAIGDALTKVSRFLR